MTSTSWTDLERRRLAARQRFALLKAEIAGETDEPRRSRPTRTVFLAVADPSESIIFADFAGDPVAAPVASGAAASPPTP